MLSAAHYENGSVPCLTFSIHGCLRHCALPMEVGGGRSRAASWAHIPHRRNGIKIYWLMSPEPFNRIFYSRLALDQMFLRLRRRICWKM